MLKLSIIILSYNTAAITKRCLTSLYKALSNDKVIEYEVIVVDNGSTDDTVKLLTSLRVNELRVIQNKTNLGFAKANNQAVKIAQGKYILFLNSDVIVDKISLKQLLNYLDDRPEVGALTVKVNLSGGMIDSASHRGFPTIWNSLCYFLGLEKIFRNLPLVGQLFGGYHLTSLALNSIHEIDSPSGAFYLTRKRIMDEVGGFDEDYFMYGEDIDLSFKIKKLGYKILYYPLFQVIHLKYASGLKKNDGKVKKYFYDAMKIFYKKHYHKCHPKIINNLVYLFIDLKSRF